MDLRHSLVFKTNHTPALTNFDNVAMHGNACTCSDPAVAGYKFCKPRRSSNSEHLELAAFAQMYTHLQINMLAEGACRLRVY